MRTMTTSVPTVELSRREEARIEPLMITSL